MNKADKELIDVKFQAINALIMSNQDMQNLKDESTKKTLDEILYHVKKTNGRVTELENQVKDHPLNCPQAEEIKKIKLNMLEIDFFKKHPIAIYAGIGVIIFIIIKSFF